ncbi:hypothetical protein Tco_1542710, partial [Tanacetum coccineum]
MASLPGRGVAIFTGLCSWFGGPFNGGNCRQCTNVSFEDEFVRNPDPISNDKPPDLSYPPSQPQTYSLDQFHCFGCGDLLEDGVRCQQCTCKWCGYILAKDFVSFALQEMKIHPLMLLIRNLSMILQTFSPTLHNPNTNHTCVNDAHYGYDCPPRVPLVFEHEPGYDNYHPQNSPSFPQQYLNCEKCRGPHEDYQCQPWHQNYSELNPCYDSNSYGFDQPPQNSINHQLCNEMNFQDTIQEIKTMMHEFLSNNMLKDCQPKNDEISHETYIPEPSRHFNSLCYDDDDDDDDEESTIPLNEITSQIPPSIAITPVLPTM